MPSRIFIAMFLASIAMCSSISFAHAQVPDQLHTEAGVVSLKRYVRDGVVVGEYWQYLPSGTRADYSVPKPIGSDPLTIIVLIHGSISSDAEAQNTALRFINRYTSDADTQWFAIIAPIFSDTNFNGPMGGYRGMIGRHRDGVEPRKTDADGFVNGILNAYWHKHPEIFCKKSLFYGHSAGGQFLSRYLVTHPDRVAAMVISAAGTYAFPDVSKPWADGMGPRTLTISWGSAPDRDYEFFPRGTGFKRAARLPVTVMVGDSESYHVIPDASFTPGFDDGSNPAGPGWSSTGAGTRHLRGELWVDDMGDYADLNTWDPGVEFQSLLGVGHSSAQTQPVALPVLLAEEPSEFDIDWLGATMAPILLY